MEDHCLQCGELLIHTEEDYCETCEEHMNDWPDFGDNVTFEPS